MYGTAHFGFLKEAQTLLDTDGLLVRWQLLMSHVILRRAYLILCAANNDTIFVWLHEGHGR